MLANNSVFVVAKSPGEVLATLFDRTDKTLRGWRGVSRHADNWILYPKMSTREISEKWRMDLAEQSPTFIHMGFSSSWLFIHEKK